MVKIDVGDLKMARELLCFAQSAIKAYPHKMHNQEAQMDRLQRMIDQIDVLRPLGVDGKHGSLHTLYCGCDYVNQLLMRTPVALEDVEELLKGIPVGFKYPNILD
jgi:hypothetical protein